MRASMRYAEKQKKKHNWSIPIILARYYISLKTIKTTPINNKYKVCLDKENIICCRKDKISAKVIALASPPYISL